MTKYNSILAILVNGKATGMPLVQLGMEQPAATTRRTGRMVQAFHIRFKFWLVQSQCQCQWHRCKCQECAASGLRYSRKSRAHDMTSRHMVGHGEQVNCRPAGDAGQHCQVMQVSMLTHATVLQNCQWGHMPLNFRITESDVTDSDPSHV